jgi:hypothetical protein
MESHTFRFKVGVRPIEFTINHDLKDYGLDIRVGFDSWLLRTNEFTEGSFISYLKRKTPMARIH